MKSIKFGRAQHRRSSVSYGRGRVAFLGALAASFAWFLVTPDAHADDTATLEQYWDDFMSYFTSNNDAASAAAVDPSSGLYTLIDNDLLSSSLDPGVGEYGGAYYNFNLLEGAEQNIFFTDYQTEISGASTLYNDFLSTINTADSTINAVTSIVHLADGLAAAAG
jgi:hypothetical protein